MAPKDRLERWGRANLVEGNKAKYRVLRLGWGTPKLKNKRLGREWIESSPEKT